VVVEHGCPIESLEPARMVNNVLWIWSGPISETITFHILSLGRRGSVHQQRRDQSKSKRVVDTMY
ncbi:hypothetical protein Tco_1486868, partial [Tanacetum coccineum]